MDFVPADPAGVKLLDPSPIFTIGLRLQIVVPQLRYGLVSTWRLRKWITLSSTFCLPTWVSATKDAQRLFALNTLNFYTPKKNLIFVKKSTKRLCTIRDIQKRRFNEENLKQNDENAPNETGALGTFNIGRDKPGKKCVKLSLKYTGTQMATNDH